MGNVPALLLLLALIVLAAGIGLRAPWPADEPRFALVAKQMVESGQWLFPFRGGEIYPDKPPMFMWAIALFYQLTGSMRVAFGVQNVFVITDYSGVDPEIPGVNGIDGSIWPRPRTYSLRLNVNF